MPGLFRRPLTPLQQRRRASLSAPLVPVTKFGSFGVSAVIKRTQAGGPAETMLGSLGPTGPNGPIAVTAGTVFQVVADGQISHLRYYHTAGCADGTTHSLSLWRVTNDDPVSPVGVRVAGGDHVTHLEASQWWDIALATPYPVLKGQWYIASWAWELDTVGYYAATPTSLTPHLLIGPNGGNLYSFGTDASIPANVGAASANFLADVVFHVGFSLDALIRRVATGSLTANAVARVPRSSSFALNAVIKVPRSGSFTVAAVRKRTFGLDERMLPSFIPTTSGSGTYTIGTRFTVLADGYITHLRHYHIDCSGTLTHKLSLWDSGGTKVAGVLDLAPSGFTGYREIALATPYAVTAGQVYTVSSTTDGGSYRYSNPPLPPPSPSLSNPVGWYSPGTDIFPNTPGLNLYGNDVVYVRSPLVVFAASALVKAPRTGSTTARAVVKVPRAGSFTASAVIKSTRSGSFAVSAVKKWTQAGSFVVRAVVKGSRTGSFTVSAFAQITRTGSFTINAVRRVTRTGTFTVSAFLQKTYAGSFTVSAVRKAPLTGSFTTNAAVRRTQAGSLTLNAVVKAPRPGSFTLSATRKTTLASAFAVSAVRKWTQTSSFTLAAVVRVTATGSTVLRADIKATVARTFNANAYVATVGINGFVLSAVAKRTWTVSRYRDVVLQTPGLRGYWRLGEATGTTAADQTGVNPGTYVNSPTLGVAGNLADGDTAATFNGTNQSVSIPDNNSLDLGDVLTLEAWVSPVIVLTARTIVSKGAGAYVLRINPNGGVRFLASGGGTAIALGSVLLTSAGWHHVVATKNGATSRIYIDGVDVTTAGTNVTLVDNSAALAIGVDAGTNFFNGTLDEVAVYGRDLTAAEIRDHYLATAVLSPTIDAHIIRRTTGTLPANAVVRATRPGSFTVAAFSYVTRSSSTTLSALVRRVQSSSFPISAVARRTASSSFTASAVVRSARAGSFVLNSVLRKSQAASFSTNAVLRVSRGGSFTVSAFFQITRTGSLTARAVVRAPRSGSFSLSAYFGSTSAGGFPASAVVRVGRTGSFPASAVVGIHRAGSFPLNATVRSTRTGSLAASAVVRRVQATSRTADAVVKAPRSGSATLDAYVHTFTVTTVGGSFTLDAIRRVPRTSSFVASALVRTSRNGFFMVRAIRKTSFAGSTTARAVVQAGGGGSFAVAAVVQKTVESWSPASIPGLAIWFDASTLASGALSPWPNLANGSLPGAVVGTPVPTVVASVLNGLPVVRFTVNEGRVRMTGTGVTTDYTVAYIARMNSAVPGRILNGIYPINNILIGWWNGYQDVAYAGGFFIPDVKVPQTTDWKLYSADGSIAENSHRLFSDGTYLGGWNQSDNWGGTLSLSGYSSTGPEETTNADVAEVVMYVGKQSDADRAQVEAYLRYKWFGIGTPSLGLLVLNARFAPPSASFTLRAVVRGQRTGSFTVNAYIRGQTSGGFTLDADIRGSRSGSFSVSAVRGIRVSGSFTARAVVRSARAASFTASAVVRTTRTSSFTLNALLLRVRTGSFSVNALLRAASTGSFTLNAVRRRTRTGSFTASAVVARSASGSFTIRSFVRTAFTISAVVGRRASATLTIDAFLRRTYPGTFTADSVKKRGFSAGTTVDATVRSTRTGGFATNAVIATPRYGSFPLDAFLEKVVSGSFSLDAAVLRTQFGSFTADAVVQATISGSFTLDASISLHIPVEIAAVFWANSIAADIGAASLDATLSAVAVAASLSSATIAATLRAGSIQASYGGGSPLTFTLDAELA